MSTEPTNLILLSADALRADHLSCYGYCRETSPVLDELAEESIRFTNAYSASSHTREAVPALLTGKFPDVAIDSKYHLATDTIVSTLSEEGFSTGGFHSNPFVSRAYGFDEGFDHFDDDLRLGQNKLLALAQRAFDKFRNRHYARAEEINERSLDWLDSLDGDRPFFLWNHYMDTHGPYEPPGEYATLYADHGLSDRDVQSLYQRAIDDPDSITDDERQLLIDLYDGEIRYNDMRIGEFLEALRERGLLEESLVIFTADHGDAFGEHGYYEHPRYLHDEITKVPLILHAPNAGRGTVTTTVSTLDIAPTLLSVVDQESGSPGDSLQEINPDGSRVVYSQARGEDDESQFRRFAARNNATSCFATYDRTTSEINIGEEGELRDKLIKHVEARTSGQTTISDSDQSEVNKEIEDRLSALGYK
ncbi:sulfatase [Haloterrigena salifodinae]|uniref:Sulfatase n=1 Tax=Haloterrigena salifodinae TaxID=2675099 RepID=A0A8T8E1Z3_9EURY|nr:sulfatase [Haloterrigena salifodinae]QRV15788.1 sulfatase [Haloterrigena salifodinae]